MPKTLAELNSALSNVLMVADDELLLEAFASRQEFKEEDFESFIQTLFTKHANSRRSYALGLARNISFSKSNPSSPPLYSKETLDLLLSHALNTHQIPYKEFMVWLLMHAAPKLKKQNEDQDKGIEWDALIIELFENDFMGIDDIKASMFAIDVLMHMLSVYMILSININCFLNITAAVIGHLSRCYHQLKNSDEIIASAQDQFERFFNVAVILDQNDDAHLLLKRFLNLNFQPVIRESCLQRLWTNSSKFEFLYNHFPVSLGKAVGKYSCSWENRDQLTKLITMGANPLRLKSTDTSPNKKSSREFKDDLNSYASDILKEINKYLLDNAAKFTVHKYEFNFFCLHFSFFGGKEYNEKIRLPHGLYKFVEAAKKANHEPHRAYELLTDALRHAQNTAPVGAQKPGKRAETTHAVYQALGNWDVDSEIVSTVIKSIRKKYIVSGLESAQLPQELEDLISDFTDASIKPLKESLPEPNELTADEKLEQLELEKNAALWDESLNIKNSLG